MFAGNIWLLLYLKINYIFYYQRIKPMNSMYNMITTY